MFRGWIRTSLIDYPAHIATVLFTGGCDLRCPFCHNAALVLQPKTLPEVELGDLWQFLKRRRGLIDGVVISGGEPTLHKGLLALLPQIKSYGMDIKLDTNGHHPDKLAILLESGTIDYVAMDVKAPPEKYAQLTGLPDFDTSRIDESIHIIKTADIQHEFRTTVVPGMLDEGDIIAIAQWIKGAGAYSLQQFIPQHTLDPSLRTTAPYPADQLARFAQSASAWVKQVVVRGVTMPA